MADDAEAATDNKLDFFPHLPHEDEEMNEVDASEDEEKRNSAQKRQTQRDERRRRNNPNRSQHEENRERDRKYNQSKRSGNRCRDPSDPGCGSSGFTNSRERNRANDCNQTGRGCNHHRSQNDPNPRRRNADQNCIRNCGGHPRCERRCMNIEDVEDVEYIADFLANEDVDFIADFLRDIDFN